MQIAVRKSRLQHDRAGRGIDLVVNHRERPRVHQGLVVAIHRENLQFRAAFFFLLNLAEVLRGQREDERDRLDLRDDHEPARVGRVDDIALVNQPHPDATGERRGDSRIVELHLRIFHSRLVGLHCRIELRDERLLRLVLLRRDHLFLDQIRVPFEVAARVFEQRLVLPLLRHRLLPLRAIRRIVNLREHHAGLHVLPLGEFHILQFAIHARMHRHRIQRLHRAEAVEENGHILLHHHARDDRHGKLLPRLRPALRGSLSPQCADAERRQRREREHYDRIPDRMSTVALRLRSRTHRRHRMIGGGLRRLVGI